MYWCETWSPTLREGRQLNLLENRVLRRLFGPKKDEITGEWRKLHNEEINDPLTPYFSGDQIEKDEMGGACSTMGRGEMYVGLWWGNLRERDYLEDSGVDGRIILRWIFRKWDVGARSTGSIRLRIGTGGGHL